MSLNRDLCLKLVTALKAAPFELPWRPRQGLKFESSAVAEQRLTLRNAWVCEGPTFRVADELDLTPDLLILDHGLGTVGLVHVVEASTEESFVDQAKRHIDQATYLRHLLVTHGAKGGPESFPLDYTVECVLVVREADANEMVDVVREVATRTRFLHATGLNLLHVRAEFEFRAPELRRAFAWLLPVTRQRLSACRPASARLRHLQLGNYRLPGRRSWDLIANRVHLLYGANGTGKSSIAEALELVVTGSVERITTNPSADYAAIIRNSESTGAATVELSLTDGRHATFEVITKGIGEAAMREGLPVSAFRLDQTVMDQLIRTTSQQRARMLTRAFFPGPAYRDLETAQDAFNLAYSELPPEVREEIRPTRPELSESPAAVATRLDWVEASSIPPERIADCLSLRRDHLQALGPVVPEITDALRRLDGTLSPSALEAGLKQLDEAVGRVRTNVRRYRQAVVQCLAVLARLEGWAPEPGEVRLGYSDLLGRWTERLALSDLLKKHLEISQTLRDARAAGWAPAEHGSPGLLAESPDSLGASVAGLRHTAEQCERELEDFFRQLQSSVRAASVGSGPLSPVRLSTEEIANLNLVGAWFARQEPTVPREQFGDTIQKALSENASKVCGTVTIGGQGWAKRPVDFLTSLQPALDALLAFEQTADPAPPAGAPNRAAEPPVYRSGLARLQAFQATLESARKVAAAYQQVEATLMRRLMEQRLNEALDEVIALFTPARWAYEGLVMNPNVRDGKVSIELLTTRTGSQADMRLNTAELNVVVLALYLLCGPTIDNPLGTVILDDPLQNMDELTSATVARGVSKVASLLPEGWQLLLMFHSDEDLETFHREVPGSVYHLPWLGPIGTTRPNGDGVQSDTRAQRPATKPRTLDKVVKSLD